MVFAVSASMCQDFCIYRGHVPDQLLLAAKAAKIEKDANSGHVISGRFVQYEYIFHSQ